MIFPSQHYPSSAIEDSTSSGVYPWSDRMWNFWRRARERHCKVNRSRVQVFTAPTNLSRPPAHVLQGIESTDPKTSMAVNPGFSPRYLNKSCLPRSIFVDLCARPAACVPAVCVWSRAAPTLELPIQSVIMGNPLFPPV